MTGNRPSNRNKQPKNGQQNGKTGKPSGKYKTDYEEFSKEANFPEVVVPGTKKSMGSQFSDMIAAAPRHASSKVHTMKACPVLKGGKMKKEKSFLPKKIKRVKFERLVQMKLKDDKGDPEEDADGKPILVAKSVVFDPTLKGEMEAD